MTKEHLRNVIGVDNEGLTPASHCYARVMARWLEVLASYAGQLNLTVITSGTVLERLRTAGSLESQIGDWRTALIHND